MDITSWLGELGLECYEQVFRDNDIDSTILPELTAEDLAELGISSIGHRRKLLLAIAKLRGQENPPQELSPTEPIATSETDRSALAASNAERRQLTVMFVDLVGSTALSGELDPEDLRQLMTSYQNTVAGIVSRFEGYIANFMGDGVLCYFGWPKAHEDAAERAVRAGLEIVRAVGAIPIMDERMLSARIGVATGLVVVGDLIGEDAAQQQAVVGETPNLAARLQAVAEPGQVVLSEATRRLLGTAFEFVDLGTQVLKGIVGHVPAFLVAGEGSAEGRFESGRSMILPMVGREQELALLMERWEQAKGGEGQCMLLVGEAGIGKSRIMRAVLDMVAREPHVRVRYQCSPYYRDSALWPVIQQLRRTAGFEEDDHDEVKLDKLETLLAQSGTNEPTPLIAELLGLATVRYGKLDLSSEAKRAQTLEALAAQIIGLANTQPVLMVLEDAHWIDPTTLELLDFCLDRFAECQVLVLVTTRPEEQPELAARPNVTRLALNRLGRVGVQAIVERLGGEALTGDVLDTIIARTDGVPLFVEELTKAILETGEAVIPASLHDSLMARLDRIPEIKDVAQIASCIGREFDYPLLAAIAERDEQELIHALDRLAATELIFRRGAPPNARYSFKHALVQDATYETLLKSTRQRLHGRIAEALEQSGRDEPELLAEHYFRAGNSAHAAASWREAGQRAVLRSAHTEAAGHLQKGLKAVAELTQSDERDRLELSLQLAMTVPLIAMQGYAAVETRQAYERASALCRALDDEAPLFSLMYGEWIYSFVSADQLAARDVAKRCLDLAQTRGNIDPLILGHRLYGISQGLMGEFSDGLSHCDQFIGLYDSEEHGDFTVTYGRDPLVVAQTLGRSLCLWHLGFPMRAREAADAALERAESLQHVPSIVFALNRLAWLLEWQHEYDAFADTVNRLNALARDHRLAQWRAWGLIADGMSKATTGAPASGADFIKQGMNACANANSRIFFSYFYSLLSRALTLAGRNSEAMQAIDEAIDLLKRSHEHACEADLYRIKGSLILADGQKNEAVAHFQHSLDIARKQKAKSFELRTSVALAHLWAEQGDRRRALDLLTPVYDWFTEGFHLPDLIKAKTLLDELK